MATSIVGGGPRSWELDRTEDRHRTYKVNHIVKAAITDGPHSVMLTAGLPVPGSIWNFKNDQDLWAFCLPTMKVRIHQKKEGDPAVFYSVEQTFSSKIDEGFTCQDQDIEDPLTEPQKVSGTFINRMKEAEYNHDGSLILSSSFERLRNIEFDEALAQVHIEQNVAALGLSTFAQMINRVNSAPLWGLPARCIKLSNASWERKLNAECYYYYTRKFDFDVDYHSKDADGNLIGFDRYVQDEGTKALNGHWDPDTHVWTLDDINGSAPSVSNPTHFIKLQDAQGNPMRSVLNGAGLPVTAIEDAGSILVAYYGEVNLLQLGIPTQF